MTTQPQSNPQRIDRVLAYLVAGLVGLSVIAFFAVIAATAVGAGANDGFSHGIWPFVISFPLFGLPLGFVMIIALLVMSTVRRSRATKQGRQ
ncbi:multidrug ABC transporter ATPase [Glaciibacter psychrotolerans]|uniref:Uncharacterized membrane protein (DUF485 family) n=1 Tax=Glaciibacter psychrotolerans TaxID=670054 RepID=A0A7Z0EAW6_9MICO|nr:multidrug ABC transporter ATPase [Leifsonia psychrotolerans]NYJ18266.1 uncharacterized membrane protein (DUF485 family) [Leifsonia psychrotolerans]